VSRLVGGGDVHQLSGAACGADEQKPRRELLKFERRRTARRRPMTWSAVDGGHVRLVVACAGGQGEIV
jgi:hypothetical protein